jgi:hypothetical protein
MAKRLTLLSLRLLALNAIIILVAVFIMTPLMGIWDNAAYHWFITILFSFLLWLFAWLDSVNASVKDVKNDKITKKTFAEGSLQSGKEPVLLYSNWFGFAAGILSQAPVLIIVIVTCFANEPLRTTLSILLRVWNITYLQVYNSFAGALPYLFLLFPVLFSVACGLAYLNGPVQQQRMETIIERNKARKAKRVQDEKKGQKKTAQQKRQQAQRR